jgi:pilus assembly protein Flp/PilA
MQAEIRLPAGRNAAARQSGNPGERSQSAPGASRKDVFQPLEELIMSKLMRFLQNEEGVTAIEYGLIASLIAVVIIGSVQAVGTNLDGVFQYVSTKLTHP